MMGGSVARTVFRDLEQFLLPNSCVACDRLLGHSEPDSLVCSVCRWRMKAMTGGCPRCRQPLPLIGSCRYCAGFPNQLMWIRSATWLDDEARELVHHLKYEGYAALAEVAAECIARNVERPAAGTLVPIPMAPSRRRTRGYNQAALLAFAVAKLWQVPVNQDLLQRARDVGTQTSLTPEARRANISGAFAATPARATPSAAGGRERGGVIIIVDDVLTTGATLSAAATALVQAGWADIGAVTFARALPFERRAA